MLLIDKFEEEVAARNDIFLRVGSPVTLSLQLAIHGNEPKEQRIELSHAGPEHCGIISTVRDRMTRAYDNGEQSTLRYYVIDSRNPKEKNKKMQLVLVRHHGDLVWEIAKDETNLEEFILLYGKLSEINLLYT